MTWFLLSICYYLNKNNNKQIKGGPMQPQRGFISALLLFHGLSEKLQNHCPFEMPSLLK